MNTEIFIILKAAFFLEGIQRSSVIKKSRTNKAKHILIIILVIIANSLRTRYKIEKNYV